LWQTGRRGGASSEEIGLGLVSMSFEKRRGYQHGVKEDGRKFIGERGKGGAW